MLRLMMWNNKVDGEHVQCSCVLATRCPKVQWWTRAAGAGHDSETRHALHQSKDVNVMTISAHSLLTY